MKEVVAKSTLTNFELSLHHERRSNELLERATSRKRLKPNYSTDGGLGLTKEDAQRAIAERQQKDEQIEKKREHNNFMRIWRMKRDSVHAEGVIARKNEKIGIKHVKEFAKQGVSISDEMLNPIDDPEAI